MFLVYEREILWEFAFNDQAKITLPKSVANFSHTHIFTTWELISQLHRTFVTQDFLAGIILCNSGASIRYFLCTCQLHTLIVWDLIFDYTHICYTKESFPNYLCNNFGSHCN